MKTSTFAVCFSILAISLSSFVPVGAQQVDGDKTIKVIRLQHADAGDMADLIDQLSQGEGDLRIAVDQRTNSLVMIETPEHLKVVEALLMQLDVEIPKKKTAATLKSGRKPAIRAKEKTSKVDQKVVTSPKTGKLKQIYAAPGTSVKRGDKLATIRVDDRQVEQLQKLKVQLEMKKAAAEERLARQRAKIESQLSTAKHAVDFAKRRLSLGMAELELEKTMLETQIENSKSETEAMQSRLKSVSTRFHAGQAQGDEVATAHAKHDVAQRSIRVAEQRLELHVAHLTPMKVMELELEVMEAKQKLESLAMELEHLHAQHQADDAASEIQVRMLGEKAAEAQEFTIVAPTNGVLKPASPLLKENAHVRVGQAIFLLDAAK